MQNSIEVSRSWPRRSRVAGQRPRNLTRVAHRDLKIPSFEHVRDPRTGVVMLCDVRDVHDDARSACAHRMRIAVAAHEALFIEHTRHEKEASAQLEEMWANVDGFDADSEAAAFRDRNAARRELALLDAHPPRAPFAPRPAPAAYEIPYVPARPVNPQARSSTSPRRARNAQHTAQIERLHGARAAHNREHGTTSTRVLREAEARSAARAAAYDAAIAAASATASENGANAVQ